MSSLAAPLTSPATPARTVAHRVLERVEVAGAYADRTLPAEADRAGLDPTARGQALRLVYGTLQRQGTLDALADALADRGALKLAPGARVALRVGLFELLFASATPAHAAVDAAVELAKPSGRRLSGLVNALLRRAAREGPAWLAGLPDTTARQAAVRHSHPPWVAELWFDALGPEAARGLMAAGNEPAERAVRANTLRLSGAELRDRLAGDGVDATPVAGLAEGLVLRGPLDLARSGPWAEGLLTPQSRASMLVAPTLDPPRGAAILDLCAAPGAKTTHLAALAGAGARIDAVERHAGRAKELERTCARLGVTSVTVHHGEAATFAAAHPGGYGAVLVDPPCTGLGTLRSHPDLRWRIAPGDPERLARLQIEILAAAAGALAPGGVLVYSTCTISPAENDAVVDALLARDSGLQPDPAPSGLPLWEHSRMPGRLLTLPHRDGTDGFFLARLRRGPRAP